MAVDPRAFRKHIPKQPERKKCPACLEEKDFKTHFYLKNRRKYYRDHRCKACKQAYQKAYAATEQGRLAHLEAQKRYLQTPAGQAAQAKARERARKKRKLAAEERAKKKKEAP